MELAHAFRAVPSIQPRTLKMYRGALGQSQKWLFDMAVSDAGLLFRVFGPRQAAIMIPHQDECGSC